MKTISPGYDMVRPVGRTLIKDRRLWMAYSATGCAFEFHGKELQLILNGDDRCETEAGPNNSARMQIRINGNVVVDLMLKNRETTLSLLQENEPVKCLVEVMKVSETAMSTAALSAILTDDSAVVKPAVEKKRKIEFVGDSITCGYGVDDEVAEHNFKTETEDATKAYACLTAKALNAEHSLVSISGYGIISGYSGDGERRKEQLLPDYYEKLGFSYGSMMGDYPQNFKWDFQAWQPDLIVINLGTNDQSFTRAKTELCEEYCQAYQCFLGVVRKNNPDAEILCLLGMMGTALCPMVEKAVNIYSAQTGDGKVHFLPLEEQLRQDGWAADWHPSQITHVKNAEIVTAYIKKLMNW